LFDDIYTTGATINEVKKVLKKAGVKKIKVIVLAH
jgi:predicted amidophosphoribosyltransferase